MATVNAAPPKMRLDVRARLVEDSALPVEPEAPAQPRVYRWDRVGLTVWVLSAAILLGLDLLKQVFYLLTH